MIKEYQKPQPLLAYDEKLGKYLLRFASSVVDYLHVLPWTAHEHIEGLLIRVHWDGKKIEWASEGNDPLPPAVDDLIHDKFDGTESVFKKMFGDKDTHLFATAYGGKINNGAYGGKERLIGLDVLIEDNFLGKALIKQVFDAFDINTVDLFQVRDLQEAIQIVSREAGESKYNLKGADTPVSGLVCYPLQRLYDAAGKRVSTLIRKADLDNVYDPNAAQEAVQEPKKAKKGSKKAN